MVSGDFAVSLTATSADLLAVAEQDFPNVEVTLDRIIERAQELGAPAGMPDSEASSQLLEIASYRACPIETI
jgi:hypothetical protein